MVHGLSAYAAVNTGYQEANVMSSKLRFFYDNYSQSDKISPSSWYNRNISVGSTTISTKELAAATDATNALKKVVIDSTVQIYGIGGYTHVDFPYVGNDAQAALFAKTLMSTDKKILASTWKKGVQVKKNDQTLVGKVIAIFGTDGTYKNDDNSHVAVVLTVSANDITVIDQNANVSAKSTDGIIRKHSLSFNGKKDALDAASYNVVELKVPESTKSPLGLPIPTGAQFKSLNIPQKINLHDVWNVTLETTEYAKSVVLTLPDVNQKLQLVPSNNNTKWTLPRYTADKAGTMRQYFVDVYDKNDVRTAAIGNYLYVDTISTISPILSAAPLLPPNNVSGGQLAYSSAGTTQNDNGTINPVSIGNIITPTEKNLYEKVSICVHAVLSVAGCVPFLGVIPDGLDAVYTAVEIPFGASTRVDLGLAVGALGANFILVGDQIADALKVESRLTTFSAPPKIDKYYVKISMKYGKLSSKWTNSEGKLEWLNPLTGKREVIPSGSTVSVDHILPQNYITTKIPNFNQLPPSTQKILIDSMENLQPMLSSANCSKGCKVEWVNGGWKSWNGEVVSPQYKQYLLDVQKSMDSKVRIEINKLIIK